MSDLMARARRWQFNAALQAYYDSVGAWAEPGVTFEVTVTDGAGQTATRRVSIVVGDG